MNDRILSLLGICKRAGKLITGADTTIDSIRKSKAKLVIFANDFSKSSKKSVQTAADECNVKTLTMNRSKEEIGYALGKICGKKQKNKQKNLRSYDNRRQRLCR